MKTNVKKFLGRENKYREDPGDKEGAEGKKREEKRSKKKTERMNEKTVRTNQTRTCQTRNDDLERV